MNHFTDTMIEEKKVQLHDLGQREDILEMVSAPGSSNFYPKGRVIFMEGTQVFGLFYVCQGKVKLSVMDESGKEVILRLASAGDIIGHRCFFTETHHGMTATAMEDAVVKFIDKADIHEALTSKPSFALKLLKVFGHELSGADTRASMLIRKNVRERLADFFLRVYKDYGVFEEDRVRLNIRLSREEMAAIIGTASETVTRYISEFKQEGIITEEDKTIYVINKKKLERFRNPILH